MYINLLFPQECERRSIDRQQVSSKVVHAILENLEKQIHRTNQPIRLMQNNLKTFNTCMRIILLTDTNAPN